MKYGTFYGVGTGPGAQGFVTLAALEAVRRASTIFSPRSGVSGESVARHCLRNLGLPEERFRDVEFFMNTESDLLALQYAKLAREIAAELRAGRDVAYLTIGDAMTYSTYGYTLAAVRRELPEAPRMTFPGVTSYAAAAAALEFPLGEGKERVLILPCPDDMAALRGDIESHDVVVLMKIGHRFPRVLTLVGEMGIAGYCSLAERIGLPGEALHRDVRNIEGDRAGYLSTMLIRRTPPKNSSSAGRQE